MRWNHIERAPRFEDALRQIGLPVVKCERQTRPPHHVRTEYNRRLTLDEKEAATRAKADVKAGTFDAAKLRAWLAKKRKPKTIPEPMKDELVAIGLIEPADDLKAGKPKPRAPALVKDQRLPAPIDNHVEIAGIKALAQQVIHTALKDAASTSSSSAVLNPNAIDKRNAVNFLTNEHGAWADSRDFWCAMADLDADALREHALKKLN